jgi:LIM-domain binding protein
VRLSTDLESYFNELYIVVHIKFFGLIFMQLVANGILRAQFDSSQKIELLEFNTASHEEFVPRARIVEAARPLHEWIKEWTKVNPQPDGKQSPEMNKKGKARPMKSLLAAPPEIDIPDSKVKLNMGITLSVFQFLEVSRTIY